MYATILFYIDPLITSSDTEFLTIADLAEIYSLKRQDKHPSIEITTRATCLASKALLMFAIVSSTINIGLLWIFNRQFPVNDGHGHTLIEERAYLDHHSKSTKKLSMIKKMWTIAHLVFATCMFDTLFISHAGHATTMIAMTGVSWAVNIWAPFSLISMELSESQMASESTQVQENGAGISIAMLSAAIYFPQIVGVILSSMMFWVFDSISGDAAKTDTGLVWLLNLGGFTSLLAAYYTTRIAT